MFYSRWKKKICPLLPVCNRHAPIFFFYQSVEGLVTTFPIYNEWESLEVGRGVGEMEEDVEVGM
jgi:hypothetical protein